MIAKMTATRDQVRRLGEDRPFVRIESRQVAARKITESARKRRPMRAESAIADLGAPSDHGRDARHFQAIEP